MDSIHIQMIIGMKPYQMTPISYGFNSVSSFLSTLLLFWLDYFYCLWHVVIVIFKGLNLNKEWLIESDDRIHLILFLYEPRRNKSLIKKGLRRRILHLPILKWLQSILSLFNQFQYHLFRKDLFISHLHLLPNLYHSLFVPNRWLYMNTSNYVFSFIE